MNSHDFYQKNCGLFYDYEFHIDIYIINSILDIKFGR